MLATFIENNNKGHAWCKAFLQQDAWGDLEEFDEKFTGLEKRWCLGVRIVAAGGGGGGDCRLNVCFIVIALIF